MQELEKVGEIINGLGDKAGDGLATYLGFNFAIDVVGYAVGAAALLIGYKLISPISKGAAEVITADIALKRIRTLVGVGSPGPITKDEIREIEIKIKGFLES